MTYGDKEYHRCGICFKFHVVKSEVLKKALTISGWFSVCIKCKIEQSKYKKNNSLNECHADANSPEGASSDETAQKQRADNKTKENSTLRKKKRTESTRLQKRKQIHKREENKHEQHNLSDGPNDAIADGANHERELLTETLQENETIKESAILQEYVIPYELEKIIFDQSQLYVARYHDFSQIYDQLRVDSERLRDSEASPLDGEWLVKTEKNLLKTKLELAHLTEFRANKHFSTSENFSYDEINEDQTTLMLLNGHTETQTCTFNESIEIAQKRQSNLDQFTNGIETNDSELTFQRIPANYTQYNENSITDLVYRKLNRVYEIYLINEFPGVNLVEHIENYDDQIQALDSRITVLVEASSYGYRSPILREYDYNNTSPLTKEILSKFLQILHGPKNKNFTPNVEYIDGHLCMTNYGNRNNTYQERNHDVIVFLLKQINYHITTISFRNGILSKFLQILNGPMNKFFTMNITSSWIACLQMDFLLSKYLQYMSGPRCKTLSTQVNCQIINCYTSST